MIRRYVPAREVAEQLGVSKTTLMRWRQTGYGPDWIPLGRRRVAYLETDVQAWLELQHVRQATP